MNRTFHQKNAIVCGSTQGIGKACALLLASLGANVTLIARNAQALEDTITQLNSSEGQRHQRIVADFAQPDQLKEQLLLNLRQPVHILVNNTGGPSSGKAVEANTQSFIQAFQQHLICNQMLVQTVVEGMKKEGYGRIINIISTSVKQPIANLGVSNTIRGAVANWAKTLSMELAPFGITVNNVLPGATKTARLESLIQQKAAQSGKSTLQIIEEMQREIPAARFAEAEEVAEAVAFLASDAASYINGVNLPVDGGRTGSL
ncbi:MAG: SDR family oxidoreductase [Thermonemataceae bacterium]